MNPLKIFPGTSWPIVTKLGMKHRRLKLIIFCSNDNPGLTLTYFIVWSNFELRLLYVENVTMMDSLKKMTMMDSLKIIASCGLEFVL